MRITRSFIVLDEKGRAGAEPTIQSVGRKAYVCSRLAGVVRTPRTVALSGEILAPLLSPGTADRAAWIERHRRGVLTALLSHFREVPVAVRSSGAEDSENDSAAGRFQSILDVPPTHLSSALAGVVESYCRPRHGPKGGIPSATAPVFVQEMIGNSATPTGPVAPLLEAHTIAHLAQEARRVSALLFAGRPIDMEWVVPTSQGTVSLVVFSEDPNGIQGLSVVTAAFGAGRVVAGDSPLLTSSYVDDSGLIFVSSGAPEIIPVRAMDEPVALQARLVTTTPPFLEHVGTFDPGRVRCYGGETLVAAPCLVSGPPLCRPTLAEAWTAYTSGQGAYAGVVTTAGSPLDHFAILFREAGIPVHRCAEHEYPLIGAAAEQGFHAVFDGATGRLFVQLTCAGLATALEAHHGPPRSLAFGLPLGASAVFSTFRSDPSCTPRCGSSAGFAALCLATAASIERLRSDLEENDGGRAFKTALEAISTLSEFCFLEGAPRQDGQFFLAALHRLLTCRQRSKDPLRSYYGRGFFALFDGLKRESCSVGSYKNPLDELPGSVRTQGFRGVMAATGRALIEHGTLRLEDLSAKTLAAWIEVCGKPTMARFIVSAAASRPHHVDQRLKTDAELRRLFEACRFLESLERPVVATRSCCYLDDEIEAVAGLLEKVIPSTRLSHLSRPTLLSLATLEQALEDDLFFDAGTCFEERLRDSRMHQGLALASRRDIAGIVQMIGGAAALELFDHPDPRQVLGLITTLLSARPHIELTRARLRAGDVGWIPESLTQAGDIAAALLAFIEDHNGAVPVTVATACLNAIDHMVELFDEAGKVLCMRLAETGLYDRYVDLLRTWIHTLSSIYQAVGRQELLPMTGYFRSQLDRIDRDRPLEVGLNEVSWSERFKLFPETPLNVHQLHNALHQSELDIRSSLFRQPVVSDGIAEIMKIASRFSALPNRLLRVGSSHLEIELALSQHRSLARLGKHGLDVEFIELSSHKHNISSKVARLHALKLWLPVALADLNVQVSCRILEVLRESQLEIRIRPDVEPMSKATLVSCFDRLKTLLDSLHRFGRCHNRKVDGLKIWLQTDLPRKFFDHIHAYHRQLDYRCRPQASSRNYAAFILTYASLYPAKIFGLYNQALEGFEPFLDVSFERLRTIKRYRIDSFRPWRSLDERRIRLLLLTVIYQDRLLDRICSNDRRLEVFRRADINEMLFARQDIEDRYRRSPFPGVPRRLARQRSRLQEELR